MAGQKENFPRCAICSEPAAQMCGGCRSEHYCGRTHQKEAWRAGHRLRCSAFRLCTNEIYGRHLVATRDIKQGETILKEKPALLGPKIVPFVTCLSCYKRIPPVEDKNGKKDYPKCTKCEWPMCNETCQASAIHRKECELMTARQYKCSIKYTGELKKESAYCVITPLRCMLLKESDPKQYDAIMSLESHLEKRINSPLYRILKANIVTFIQQVLGLVEFDEETILRIAAILDTNAYDIRNNAAATKLRGIYLTASMVTHDCVPNTKHIFSDKDYCMSVIATVPINKGEMITTTYTQPLWGTLVRRAHLQNVKCFWCTCKRCSDPTELQTYAGAIYCSECYEERGSSERKNTPKMISTDPLDNAADWKCPVCEHKIQAKQMVWGNEAIKKDLSLLDRLSPRSLESFIDKYEGTLHPTNAHILELKFAMCQIYGHIKGFTYSDMNPAALNRKQDLCEEMMEILDVVQPGLSQARGMMLLELQEVMFMKTKRELATSHITKEAAQESLMDCMVMLQDATNILKVESDMQDILDKRLHDLASELND